jgi:IAP75 family protein translocase
MHLITMAFGGGGGVPGDGSGGGGGGGGGGFGVPPAHADEDDDEDDEDDDDDDDDDEDDDDDDDDETPRRKLKEGNFIVESVLATNLPTGPGIPTKAELFGGLNARRGNEVSRDDLSADLEALLNTGLFANVDANVTPKGKDGYAVEFVFREKIWPGVQSFKVKGATALPPEIEREVLTQVKKQSSCTVRVLATMKNVIEGYYTSKGLTFGTISHFDGMETGDVIAHVIEGEITRVKAVFLDDQMQPVNRGRTHPRVIQREHNFKVGQLYNVEDAKTALRDIFLLQLFDNVQVVPRPDDRDQSKVQVDIMLRERPVKTAESELEWSVAPGEGGKPDLVSIKPGGSVFFEHRNLDGWGRQLYGSVSTANFLQPQDDLGFKLEYHHPYCLGDGDPDKTNFKTSVFNSRKLSPVFTGGPQMEEVPSIWVDRAGAKATITQNFSRQSKATASVVLEEVTARDESGAVVGAGAKPGAGGAMAGDGPPTTHSGTGTDRIMFAQGGITRDTTRFVNGTPVGARDIFNLDQSVGLGSGFPIYNRFAAESTRFIQLRPESQKTNRPPPVAVVHAKAGHILGNCAAYDAFVLGGPHSCRGYNVGELGASRSFLEYAAELRVPVPYLNTHAFAFWERCTDLGSSKTVPGNPTEYYRRAGGGSSMGVGIKLGPVRAEYATDGNQANGTTFVRFGERF